MTNKEMPTNLVEREYRSDAEDPDGAAMNFMVPSDMLPDEWQVTALATFQLLHGHLTPEGCKATIRFLAQVVEGYDGSGQRGEGEGESFDVTGMTTVELQAELTRRGVVGGE